MRKYVVQPSAKAMGMGTLQVMLAILCCFDLSAQIRLQDDHTPVLTVGEQVVIQAPAEGLWSVATQWENNWMSEWVHANPQTAMVSGDWTIVSGKIELEQGALLLRDSYRQVREGMIQCIRRYEWQGDETLE